MDKIIKTPGPDHPIDIEPTGVRMQVRAGGAVIATSAAALMLREAGRAPVLYIPRVDIDMSKLVRTTLSTYCPYKGECAYYSVVAAGPAGENAAWSYEAPYPAVAAIKDHLAFYPERVDAIERV
jgi:uncharacterized protein (DUF427 family)